jgi:hypothetical protein
MMMFDDDSFVSGTAKSAADFSLGETTVIQFRRGK